VTAVTPVQDTVLAIAARFSNCWRIRHLPLSFMDQGSNFLFSFRQGRARQFAGSRELARKFVWRHALESQAVPPPGGGLGRVRTPPSAQLRRLNAAVADLDSKNQRAANLWRDLPPNGEAQISLIPFPLRALPWGGAFLRQSGSWASSPIRGRPAATGRGQVSSVLHRWPGPADRGNSRRKYF
jgi:hypothetical protein